MKIITSQPNDIRIVILGKTGSGKSSAGNIILGEENFKVSCLSKSETQICESSESSYNGRKITVVDTPGIFDTDRSEKDLKQETVSCLVECAPGPHVFILVIKIDRYTKEEKEAVRKLLQWFGEEALKRTVILFTHGDKLKQGVTVKDYINSDADLKKIIDKCEGRVHVIDSTGTEPREEFGSNAFQVKQLMETIAHIVTESTDYYTNESLERIGRDIETEARNIMKELEEAGEKQTMSEIRRRARERVRTKSLRSIAAGSVGVLLGILLGTTVGPSFPAILAAGLLSIQRMNFGCTVFKSIRKDNRGSRGGSCRGRGDNRTEAGALGAGVVTGIGLGVTAGVLAAVGAVRGGIEGAKAAARADYPKEVG
uniref:Si:dkey-125e8.4 n=1 Tax=Scleropages formosus TaxID=113540 RepID=A0A8C9SU23_SCLFO